MVQRILLGTVEEIKMDIKLSWLSKQSHTCKESSYVHNEALNKTNNSTGCYLDKQGSGSTVGDINFRLVVRKWYLVTFIAGGLELSLKDT